MKKLMLLTLSVVLVFCLVACGQAATEQEDTQSATEQETLQDTEQQDSNTLLYASGDDLDSFLSEFDEKYYSFIKESLTSVKLTTESGSFGLHIYASGISIDDAKKQMESIFGFTLEDNDGAYLFNDTDNATVYILDVSDEGIYIRYDFFNDEDVNEIASRGYFSVYDSIVPKISDDAVEVERAFYLDTYGSELYVAYEYPEDKLSEIWDDYQEKLSELDNYELVEDDGQRGIVYLDNGLTIETSVDTGWGRIFVTLRKTVEE